MFHGLIPEETIGVGGGVAHETLREDGGEVVNAHLGLSHDGLLTQVEQICTEANDSAGVGRRKGAETGRVMSEEFERALVYGDAVVVGRKERLRQVTQPQLEKRGDTVDVLMAGRKAVMGRTLLEDPVFELHQRTVGHTQTEQPLPV